MINVDLHLQQELYGYAGLSGFGYARNVLLGDIGLPYHVYNVLGGGTLRPNAFFDFFKNIGLDPMATAKSRRAAAVLNVGYVIHKPIEDNADDLLSQFEQVKPTLPRAMVVGDWKVIPDVKQAMAELLSEKHNPFRTVIVDRATQSPESKPASGDVDELVYDWNRVTLKVHSSGRAMVLLNDSIYPGWKVLVDDQSQPILRGNGLFRAVMIDAGEHDIQFIYDPWQFKFGMTVAGCTLLLLAGLFVVGWRDGSIARHASIPSN